MSWLPTKETLSALRGITAVLATLVSGLWAAYKWFAKNRKDNEQIRVNSVVSALLSQHQAASRRLVEDSDLRAAVVALRPGELASSSDERTHEALLAAAKGDVQLAEALFAQEAAYREAQALQHFRKANRLAAVAYRHHGALATLHDTKKALSAYRKATELDPDNFEGWDQLARLLTRLGEFDEALGIYERPLENASPSDRQIWRATALNSIGAIHRKRGHMDLAEKYAREALQLSEQHGLEASIGAAHSNLGNIYKNLGLLDQAEEFHRIALAIHTRLGLVPGMANDHGNLGNIYKRRGKLRKAARHFEESLALEKNLGRKEGMAADFGNLGEVFELRGQLAKARQHYERALTLNRELHRKEGIAIQLFNLANVDQRLGNLDKARLQFGQSQALFDELGNRALAEDARARHDQLSGSHLAAASE